MLRKEADAEVVAEGVKPLLDPPVETVVVRLPRRRTDVEPARLLVLCRDTIDRQLVEVV